MIDLDRLSEAVDTLRANPIRTSLTAFSVAWGIFMLVMLLGAGTGLQNTVESEFKDDAANSVWLYRGRTSLPHRGNPPGRQITFRDRDFDAVAEHPGVETPTGRVYVSGRMTYKNKSSAFDVRSVHPAHKYIEGTKMLSGRFINELDIERRRKVVVLGTEIVVRLFGEGDDVAPLGERVEVLGTSMTVVGVFTDEGNENEVEIAYLPITTAQQIYGRGTEIDQLMFTVGDFGVEETEDLIDDLRNDMARRHGFLATDKSALRIRNNLERFIKVTGMFEWIRNFVWVVGIGTLIAGMVGVSNIMLISVRERTREIGLRKALGATPGSIVSQIVVEATMLTSLSGYVGLVTGAGVLELLSRYLPKNDYVNAPQVELGAALGAVGMLVVAGILAGYIPARRAARIKPVEALRSE